MKDHLFLLAAIVESVPWWWLDLTTKFVRFPIVQYHYRMEPTIEHGIHAEVICVCRALQKSYPSKHFELLPSFIKIDETIGYRIRNRRVDHSEVS